MATTSLKLSSKSEADGKSQVIVRLSISRSNRPCFKTGVFVRPDWFKPVQETKKGFVYGIVVPKKGIMNVRERIEAEKAKTKLDAYLSRLSEVSRVLAANEESVTQESITEAMRITKDMPVNAITYEVIRNAREKKIEEVNAKTFFEWTEFYLKKKEVSEVRKRGFRVLVRTLARYEKLVREIDNERKDFTLDVHTIDKETLEDFFDFMANEKELSEEYPEIYKRLLNDYPSEFTPKHKSSVIHERGHNVLVVRKKALKSFFNWMVENKYTTNRPFDGLKIGSEVYGTPFFLTLEERNAVSDRDFSGNKHLETQRDIFIFQCCVGVRCSDLMKLKQDNLVEKEGVLTLEYIPRKTKDKKPFVVSVPLNDRARLLVEKYKGVDGKGRLFPFISSQKYNDAIKAILSECEIKRVVTIINPTTGEEEQRPINEVASSHMARRTFIGCLYKKVKDPNLIGKLSGHIEGSRAFARYRAIDMDVMKETVSLID